MKRFLIGLLLAFPVFALAQSNFQKGYVITVSNDTIKGFIDYRERKSNPESIRFRLNNDAPIQTYNVLNCIAFGLDGLETYQRYDVRLSMNEEAISKLSGKADSISVRDTLFLKVLQTGKVVRLYEYTDEIKKRFFLAELNGAPYELIRRLYLDENTNNMVTADSYLNQLSQASYRLGFAAKFDRRKLMNVKYRTADLLKVTSVLNGVEPIKVKGTKTRVLAGAGINYLNGIYKGSHLLARPDAKSKVSYSPFINLGVDVFSNPAIGKLIYRAELSAYKSQNEISSPSRFHSFDQLTISAAPQLIYNVYNKSKIKVFIGGGMAFNYSIVDNDVQKRYNTFKNEFVVLEEPLDFEKFSVSFVGKAGIVLNKRIEIYGGYSTRNVVSHYAAFNIGSKRIAGGINYLFGKP
ncbi:hypothetical protein [Pedobacter frigoris]|uniref:PorT family protein n=1 Tax=Pedobacter frigoris TaxID=2571272 RepID=A0A4U1CIB9_9SPHI|nr:hypothetical protein [Pedobacter frigoris]TKC07147.1 hypothetical protein FA047_07770 [Pedobacter frigoris]